MVKGKYVSDILEGRKKATIRKGIVKPKYREMIIHGGGRPIAKIFIERVYHRRVRDLSNEDALKDGFSSREELIEELKKVYKDINEESWVTIIEFRVVQRMDHLSSHDPYMGLSPVDIARIALRYLSDELNDMEKKILLDLTRTNSIRATTLRLYGSLNKRFVVRRILKKALTLLIEKGYLKKEDD
ncbi:MAG: ASCH domain-containing protein [Desulfurococcales archaeon ex4484_58]|nr:MAG: ASCH domain-containing protein [Desulfurococcales archaeon ex4484_58]